MRLERDRFDHTPPLRVVFRYWRWDRQGGGGIEFRVWRRRWLLRWGK